MYEGKSVKCQVNANATLRDFITVTLQTNYPAITNILQDNTKTVELTHGFPPSSIVSSSLNRDQSISELGIKSGIVVTILIKTINNVVPGQITTTTSKDKSILRRVIKADNSCLFNAIGYLINKQMYAGYSPLYREAVANIILNSNSDLLCESMIGKPKSEYAQWIQNNENWGGEI